MLLSDKTVAITGAASGNGRGIAKRYAEHGADVVVADIREDPRLGGTPTHELLPEEYGVDAEFVECNVRSREAFEPVMDACDRLGGIDVMVNNAGVSQIGERKGVLETTKEDIHELFEINLYGVLHGCQAAIERMLEDGTEGSIINLSSYAALEAGPGVGSYSMSKSAILLMTYSMANSFSADGIRVNAIIPGFMKTAMTKEDQPIVGTDFGDQIVDQQIPMDRFGTPEDVGGVAVFLGSDLTSYVTAEAVLVDGGATNTLVF